MQCDLGEWSDWSSASLTPGQCGEEERTRKYIAEEKFTFAESCNGFTTSCPSAQMDTRTMCKCFTFIVFTRDIIVLVLNSFS